MSPNNTSIDVFARDIGVGANGVPTLGYRINGGSFNYIAVISNSSCQSITTISGFNNGDTIRFETAQLYEIGGSESNSCPGTSGGTTYDVVASGSGQDVAITINRDNIP